jgi:cytochrome c-type biogenesis protein CcmH/NrfF
MIESVVNVISARQSRAAVNEWLVSHVGDRFLAGTPVLDAVTQLWRIPILYVYPNEGPLGSVGEAAVDSLTGEMLTHTPSDEIKNLATDIIQRLSGELRA